MLMSCLHWGAQSGVECHESGVEWSGEERKNHLPWSAPGRDYFDAAQVMSAFHLTFPDHIEDFPLGLVVFMRLILTQF